MANAQQKSVQNEKGAFLDKNGKFTSVAANAATMSGRAAGDKRKELVAAGKTGLTVVDAPAEAVAKGVAAAAKAKATADKAKTKAAAAKAKDKKAPAKKPAGKKAVATA